MPETYCVKLFDVQVDRCEAPYNVKIEKKSKRKVETDQSDQPMKKKMRVAKAARSSSLDSDATEKTIKSILYDLITDPLVLTRVRSWHLKLQGELRPCPLIVVSGVTAAII